MSARLGRDWWQQQPAKQNRNSPATSTGQFETPRSGWVGAHRCGCALPLPLPKCTMLRVSMVCSTTVVGGCSIASVSMISLSVISLCL